MSERIQWDKLRQSVSAEVAALNPGLFTQALIADTKDMYKSDTKGDIANERELQKLCEHELSRRNIWFIHLSPKARERAGTPDIICAVNGVAYGIELKSSTGRLSEAQKSTLELMASNGWKTYVVRSYQEFVEALDGKGPK